MKILRVVLTSIACFVCAVYTAGQQLASPSHPSSAAESAGHQISQQRADLHADHRLSNITQVTEALPQPPSAAVRPQTGQPSFQQSALASQSHGTHQLLVLSTITFLPAVDDQANSSATLHDSTGKLNIQQDVTQPQPACVSIQVQLSYMQQHDLSKSSFAGSAHTPSTSDRTRNLQQPAATNPAAQAEPAAIAEDEKFHLGSSHYLICGQEPYPASTNRAAAAVPTAGDEAVLPHHEAVLLVAMPAPAVPMQPSSISSGQSAAAAAITSPLLLILHAEQHAGGKAYLWTGSQVVPAGAGSVSLAVDMRQYSYSWSTNPPTSLTQQATNSSSTCHHNGTATAHAEVEKQQSPPNGSAIFHNSSISDSLLMPAAKSAGAAASISECPALQRLLPGYALWSPADAAYAVAALLDSNPMQELWAKQLLANAQAMRSSSNDNSRASDSESICPAWGAVAILQHVCAPAIDSRSICDRAPPLVNFDATTQLVTVHATKQQLCLAAAGLLLVLLSLSCTISGSRTKSHPSAVAVAPEAAAATQLAQQQQALQRTFSGGSLEGYRLPDVCFQQDQYSSLATVPADDPFGYGGSSSAVVTAAHPTGPATVAAAYKPAVAAAVRRASAVAVNRAAGTLKAAFANKSALPHAVVNPAPGTNPTAAAAAIHGIAVLPGPNTAMKQTVAMYDEADEDAVNQLPASLQAHLQAAGRWTRGKGGRLVRGSMRALRAVSNTTARAVSQVLQATASGSNGAAVAVGLGGGVAGRGSVRAGQFPVYGGGIDGSSDAALLHRLMVAGPGTELVLSDDEA